MLPRGGILAGSMDEVPVMRMPGGRGGGRRPGGRGRGGGRRVRGEAAGRGRKLVELPQTFVAWQQQPTTGMFAVGVMRLTAAHHVEAWNAALVDPNAISG